MCTDLKWTSPEATLEPWFRSRKFYVHMCIENVAHTYVYRSTIPCGSPDRQTSEHGPANTDQPTRTRCSLDSRRRTRSACAARCMSVSGCRCLRIRASGPSSDRRAISTSSSRRVALTSTFLKLSLSSSGTTPGSSRAVTSSVSVRTRTKRRSPW